MKSDTTYKPYFISSEEDLVEYKRAFEKNGSPKRLPKLIWMHLKNPLKEPLVSMIKDSNGANNSVAAIYAVMPVFFKINGQIEKACQSLDTLTDVEHRGKGLFVNNAKNVYKKAKEKEMALVYGFPNGKSVHGFVKKLGWKLLDPVPFLYKPLRTGYFLKKIVGNRLGNVLDISLVRKKKTNLPDNVSIKNIETFSDDATELWSKFSSAFSVSIHRDASYLNWRFKEKPEEHYIIKGYYENELLKGFVVYTFKQKHGGNICYIMELIFDLETPSVGKELIKYAANQCIAQKTDVMLSWCFSFSPNFDSYKSNGFYILPEKLKPIELHFGYTHLAHDEDILKNRENWYVSYADSDTV